MKKPVEQSIHYYFQMYPIYPPKDNTYRNHVQAEEIAFEDIPDDVEQEKDVFDNETYMITYEAEENGELIEESDYNIGDNEPIQ